MITGLTSAITMACDFAIGKGWMDGWMERDGGWLPGGCPVLPDGLNFIMGLVRCRSDVASGSFFGFKLIFFGDWE